MKIDVRYNEDETKAIILAAHVARFGEAPDGMEWVAEYGYSGEYTVTASEIKTADDIEAAIVAEIAKVTE